ncbi:MAG: hypothetical protein ACYDAR_02600 [Thermomicrobiales bacterium]
MNVLCIVQRAGGGGPPCADAQWADVVEVRDGQPVAEPEQRWLVTLAAHPWMTAFRQRYGPCAIHRTRKWRRVADGCPVDYLVTIQTPESADTTVPS